MTSIQGIYIALYGRPADPSGLAYYTDVTNNGEDLSSIGDLSSVPEYQDRFADMSSTEIVTSIYESLFERAPDAEGLAFYVALLEESSANINRIAIDILNGAQNEDLATINAKIAAADLFTMHLDTDAEVAAYVGNDAAAIGRAFIDTVNADDEGTGEEADASILQLFPDQGQAPGEEPITGGGGGGSGSSGPSFGVRVTADGTLEFTGSASGDVSVNKTEAGELIFYREGKPSVLDDDATISRIEDGVTIRSLGDSQVLARGEDGKWDFKSFEIGELQLDAIDFYFAIKGHANVLMLSEFSLDASWEQLTAITEFFNSGVLESWFSEISGIDELVDTVAGLVATSENLTVAAADGAQSSLNPLLEFLIGSIGGEGIELPNIGLPILLNGEANELSANGSEGFTLVGNYEFASNDTLIGGVGDDILLGLRDTGAADFTVDLYAGESLGLQSFAYSDINDVGEVVIVNGYDGEGVALTAIAEELPGGDNIMRISSASTQIVTLVEHGNSDFGVQISMTAGDVAFVNVGEGGTFKVSHSGGETSPKSTNNELNEQIEREIDADLIAFGDQLTGGDGADIFVHLYDDGVDVITDFDRGEGDSLMLQVGNFDIFNSVDLDGIGEADDSFIAFYDLETGEYLLNAGVAILGTADFSSDDLFGYAPLT